MDNQDILFYLSICFILVGACVCVLGLLIRGLLYRMTKDWSILLLSVGIIASLWHVFIYYMIYTGKILHYPHIYNKGLPFYYLIAPCFYFYVRYRLKPNSGVAKYWVLHLLPFFWGLIDIIPYAVATLEEKKTLLDQLIRDVPVEHSYTYGFVDQKLHYIARFSLAIFYVFFQWWEFYATEEIDKKLRKDIFRFNSAYTVYLVLQYSIVLAILFNDKQEVYILKSLDKLVWASFCFFLFSFWFIVDSIFKIRQQWKTIP